MPRNRQLKVVVLGESGVGKTSLLTQYLRNEFSANGVGSTIGVDCHQNCVLIDEQIVTMQFWDTGGMERFHAICPALYRGADCCVLVFDVTNATSFKRVKMWRDEFLIYSYPPDPDTFPFVLLGNKIEMKSRRTVSVRQAETWSALNGNVPYFEVSARNATNVEDAFQAITRSALQRNGNGVASDSIADLDEAQPQRRWRCCAIQ